MATAPGDRDGPNVLIHEHVSGGGLVGIEPPASWLAEGSAMRRALAGDFAAAGARISMTLDARLPDEPGPWTTLRIVPGTAARSLPALASRADHTILIAPETGGLLRDLALALERSGAHSLGSSSDAIGLAADKLRVADHLFRAGVPHPETRIVHPRLGLPRDVAYPAVLKPIDGAGAVDTLWVASHDDPIVETFPADRGILQPFVRGEARSATFIIRQAATPWLVGVGRQEIPLREGRFQYEGGSILVDDLPDDHPAHLATASVPGLAGLVGVDYIQDPASACAVVLDINPRPTTSCVGLVAALGAGRLAAAWLAMTGNRPGDLPPSPAASRRPCNFRADGSARFVDSFEHTDTSA